MNRGIVRGLLWLGFAMTALIFSAGSYGKLRSGAALPMASGAPPLPAAVLLFIAYVVMLWFSARNVGDYPKRALMRAAWWMIAAAAAAGLARIGFEYMAASSPALLPWIGLRQIPNVLHSALILSGALTMWAAFSRLGMGGRFRWPHGVAIAAILAWMPVVNSVRDHLPDSHSAFAFIRILQSSDPLFILAGAAAAVMLFSIGQEIGRSEMGLSVGFLVAYSILKPLAFGARALVAARHPLLSAVLVGLARSCDWSLALSVFCRWKVTERSRALADEYKSR
jgi:hypothetical protein